MWPSSDYHQAPYHSEQGHSPRPPEHQPGSWLPENMGEGREEAELSPPPTLVSIITPGDGHSCTPGKEQQEAAGSKCRVAQPGHHGENTKNKPKKSPRPRATVHILTGPKKVPDKGCFHFLWPSSASLHYINKIVSLDCKPSRAGTLCPLLEFSNLEIGYYLTKIPH